MDEAFVIVATSVATDDSPSALYAFPFATKRGAEQALAFLHDTPGVSAKLIDDHEAE